MPFGFWWLHKRKVRWDIQHTEQIGKILEEGLQKAPEGRIRDIEDISNQLENFVALGGTLDQDRYDEMIQTVHTVRSEKVLKRAWRKAQMVPLDLKCQNHKVNITFLTLTDTANS